MLQKLHPQDPEQRTEFAYWFLARITVDNAWPWNILWSDEVHFILDGAVNTQNCCIWSTVRPHMQQTDEGVVLDPEKETEIGTEDETDTEVDQDHSHLGDVLLADTEAVFLYLDRRRSRSRSRERDRDRDRRRDRHRSRSRSLSPRGRSPRRHRSRSPRRRSWSRSPRRKMRYVFNDNFLDKDLEGKTEEEQDMIRMMGFSSFDSTKGKHVKGNGIYSVHIIHKRKYRQYMNRKGGFNRPLDFVA
ncbi:U4/U6.U5 small nuclear ribonucleoprotein 27 kDa protein-like [Centruroides sculpturatus]|uniref:U4/U6.U5 small nuclear ribonucleoprotein 27 kDa protein-like n=1 Tax=Centruroides sculpturatus TaxID=218467 RepID=UPI000C6DCD88|nr:U4/U6.U5 small nuclear ribonucleoprotein 27 kDa protein-like [Centruroides sculpturatus]